jgi:hypothetical protein
LASICAVPYSEGEGVEGKIPRNTGGERADEGKERPTLLRNAKLKLAAKRLVYAMRPRLER